MSTVGRICNRDVVVIDKDASVMEAARRMRAHHVGDLVIINQAPQGPVPLGIITDRDLVLEVLAEDVDLARVTVGDIMSFELVTAREDDDVIDTIKRMRAKAVRRMPVINVHNTLVGIVAVDDLIDLFAEQLGDLARLISREQTRERRVRRTVEEEA
jgi:CBS domain-containing protein